MSGEDVAALITALAFLAVPVVAGLIQVAGEREERRKQARFEALFGDFETVDATGVPAASEDRRPYRSRIQFGPWKLYPRPDFADCPDCRSVDLQRFCDAEPRTVRLPCDAHRVSRGGYVPGLGETLWPLTEGERLIGSDGRVWKVVRK